MCSGIISFFPLTYFTQTTGCIRSIADELNPKRTRLTTLSWTTPQVFHLPLDVPPRGSLQGCRDGLHQLRVHQPLHQHQYRVAHLHPLLHESNLSHRHRGQTRRNTLEEWAPLNTIAREYTIQLFMLGFVWLWAKVDSKQIWLWKPCFCCSFKQDMENMAQWWSFFNIFMYLLVFIFIQATVHWIPY